MSIYLFRIHPSPFAPSTALDPEEDRLLIADPDVAVISECGAVLEDGFGQFPQIATGMTNVAIDV